jgi:thioredoxin 1
MKPIELNIESFVENVEKDGIFIIDFWASWCAPCKAFAPIFEAAAEKYPDITWGKVDTDAQVELATELGIRSIPTLMVFRDGVLLLSQPGALPKDVLDEIVDKTRTIDMAEVRRQIAEAESAAE